MRRDSHDLLAFLAATSLAFSACSAPGYDSRSGEMHFTTAEFGAPPETVFAGLGAAPVPSGLPGYRSDEAPQGALASPSSGSTLTQQDTQGAAPSSEASDESFFEELWTREKLTGDWGGLRTKAADTGITVDAKVLQFYQGVTSGGRNTNWEYGGLVDTVISIDGSKAPGLWDGLILNLHANTQ